MATNRIHPRTLGTTKEAEVNHEYDQSSPSDEDMKPHTRQWQDKSQTISETETVFTTYNMDDLIKYKLLKMTCFIFSYSQYIWKSTDES